MKKYLIWSVLLLILNVEYTSAQVMDSAVVNPDLLSKMKEEVISKYDISRESKYIIYLPMNYSKFLFTEEDKELFLSLKDTLIEQIDLVYTVFRRSETFDQVKLNKERYEMLQDFFPETFNNNLIRWNLMAQNGAVDYEDARTYFHGFVIYLKPHHVTTKEGEVISTVRDLRVDDPETRSLELNEEIAAIKKVMSKSTATKTVYDTTYTEKKKRVWTGMYWAKNKKKRKKGKKFKTKGRQKRPKEYVTKIEKEMVIKEREVPDLEAMPEPEKVLQTLTKDTVVYTAMNRIFDKYEDHVVVQDVTGSMHPYLTQTLLFLQSHLQTSETEKFVFYNDGDDKPDGPIGRSGGTYYVSSDKYKDIEEMAFEAMENGRGGKEAENDVEACLYGIKKFPKCKGVILIADNYSRMRDFKLIPRLMALNKPVRIIICGIAEGENINLDYIYLAKYTKGSLHTLHEDIAELDKKTDGSAFKIGTQYFKVEGSAIRLIRDSKSKRDY
jgi:hypothetical protein